VNPVAAYFGKHLLFCLRDYLTVCLISRTAPINPAGYSGESLLK
jgi:hypothetical protein